MEWKCNFIEEILENTKGVSSSRKSKDRHYTGQQQPKKRQKDKQ
jgi:hypothetical protein